MAKKGEIRPWRVDFKWSHGVSSCETFIGREEAELFVEQVAENMRRRESGGTIELRRRIAGPRGSYLLVTTTEV